MRERFKECVRNQSLRKTLSTGEEKRKLRRYLIHKRIKKREKPINPVSHIVTMMEGCSDGIRGEKMRSEAEGRAREIFRPVKRVGEDAV